MANVTAIVLAAGLSRRMGDENKLLLPIEGKAMVDHVIEKVQASNADELIIVGSPLSMDHLQKWAEKGLTVINNPRYETGMTSTIQEGVNAADGDGYMICLGDQPKTQTETYDQLIEAFKTSSTSDEQTIACPFLGDRRGNPTIFSKHYREQILAHPEPEGCKSIIQDAKEHLAKVEVNDTGVLMDVDTREDYERFTE